MKTLKILFLSALILSFKLNLGMEQDKKRIKLDPNLLKLENKKQSGLELIEAAKTGDLEKAKKLINQGADVNVKNQFEVTALIWASAKGYDDIVDELIKAGTDLNAKAKLGKTALMYAISSKNEKIVDLLLKAGANINEKNDNGQTALDILNSMSFDNKEEIKKLIESAIIKKELIKNLKEELFKSIKSAVPKDINKILIKLKRENITLSLHDKFGNNPLHMAVILPEDKEEKFEDKKKIIGLILNNKKDLINEKNNQNLPPIELALGTGNLKTVELLTQ